MEVLGGRVQCGANGLEVVPGMTVAQARQKLGEVLNIPDGATALINGVAAAETDFVPDGGQIEFIKPAGTKG